MVLEERRHVRSIFKHLKTMENGKLEYDCILSENVMQHRGGLIKPPRMKDVTVIFHGVFVDRNDTSNDIMCIQLIASFQLVFDATSTRQMLEFYLQGQESSVAVYLSKIRDGD